VETCGGERIGEFVIERREASIFARKTQSALGLKRTLLRNERTGERDLRPSVTRLKRDGLTGQIERPRRIVVRREPIRRADKERQITRLVFERRFKFAFRIFTLVRVQERQDNARLGRAIRRV